VGRDSVQTPKSTRLGGSKNAVKQNGDLKRDVLKCHKLGRNDENRGSSRRLGCASGEK
jgi:hypothetical protein